MQDCIWNYLHLRPSGSILYVWTIVTPFLFLKDLKYIIRLPWWLCDEEPAWQCRRGRFNSQYRKIFWWRKWQPSPVFLLGKYHGQRSLVGYSPWGHKRIGHNLVIKQHWREYIVFCSMEKEGIRVHERNSNLWVFLTHSKHDYQASADFCLPCISSYSLFGPAKT